ncbi:hypothetical protein Btru_075333 [Bulinus truncatus]|nr:hypothetical protein Btru_075333 [Bulinus truncatus]
MQKCEEVTTLQESCHGNTPNQDHFLNEDTEREDNLTGPKDTSPKRSLEYTGCPPSTKQLSPYDHNPGYPTLACGGDHANHLINPFVTTRSLQDQLDLTSPQGFHHVTLKSPVTPQAPTGYWSETSVHHPSCRGDPYGQLGAYGGFSYAYDTLLRGAVYQDGLGRGNNGHDCLSYESLTRPNYLLETLTIPAPALDGTSRPAVYYARQADNPQGNTCLAVDMYGNSLRDGTGNQFHLSNGIVYQDDVHTAANFPHFTGLIYRPALGEN